MSNIVDETKSGEKTIEIVYLKQVNCPTCYVIFAITDKLYIDRQKNGKDFYCPLGHSMVFGATDDAAELRRKLEREQQNSSMYRNLYDRTSKELTVKKGQLTKIKNRVAKGVCPCCNRTFNNLQRHMHTQHPDFESTESAYENPPPVNSPYKLSTFGAIQSLKKDEFTVSELLDVLARNKIERPNGSIYASLSQLDGRKIKSVRGSGKNKVYRIL